MRQLTYQSCWVYKTKQCFEFINIPSLLRQDATFKIETHYVLNKNAELPGLLIHVTKLKTVKAATVNIKTLAKSEYKTKSDPSAPSIQTLVAGRFLEGQLRL